MSALACVIGDMDMVHPLAWAGIGCVVAAPRGSPPTWSRLVRDTIPCSDDMTEEAWLAALLRFGAAQAEKPVLYMQNDARLLMVSRHRARLAAAFRLPLAAAGLVEALVDKARFAELAEARGLPVPPTRRIVAGGDARAAAGLRFPVVVKPVTRVPRWDAAAGGAKALEAATPDDIAALLLRLGACDVELLVQEMIPGPETRIESHHLYVDPGGAVVADFTGRKIRTWPERFGHSTALEITEAPDVVALGREVARRIGLTGVAKLDFKRGPDGALHLLEINPRFNLWHHLGAVAGLNLPALVHADLCGLPRPPVGKARAGVTWCRPRGDWHAARAAGIPPLAWAGWMLRCGGNASFDARDPMPFLGGVLWNGLRRQLRARLGRGARPAEAR
jgi:predicted ATP-grasp superfamily ATP-dependent carboligase